ncbi:MAG: protein kinase, partial [Myxococcota bacterium]
MEPERYELGRFVLDAGARRLTRAGEDVPLPPDALDALIEMVRRPGRAIAAEPAVSTTLRAALGAQGDHLERIGGGLRWTGPVRRLTSIDLADRKGHFEVLGLLGEGGMGQVWLVRHPVLHRRFAVKVVSASNPHLNARILREARAQARVQHGNVLEVLDVFEIDGRPAMLLPLVEGPTLQAVCARSAPSLDTWFPVFREVVAGVAAIHAAGLVHRDLKPSNILLDVSGPRIVPKIADFGVAKALEDHRAHEHLTGAGVALGTPSYAAPEQLRDAGSADARADVWALGCILHQLATGAPPRRVGARVVLDDLGPLWNTLIDRMVREDPNDRFPDAAAVASALPEHSGSPDLALALARTHTPTARPDTPVLATMIPSAIAAPEPSPDLRGPSRRALLWGAAVGLGAAAVYSVRNSVYLWSSGAAPRGGTLRFGSSRARGPLGVATSVSSMWAAVRSAVFEPLVSFDDQGAVVPAVVARWDRPTPRTLRLVLRGDLQFHDHPATPGGRPATAHDLAHTMQIAVERGWVSGAPLGVEVVGDAVVL